ncbi:MAG: hypothetical protein JRI59_07555 [Deltaproteobacteria bacterium]|nr:hypothetical protein [Deltaproteobacteria bacterium]
MCGEINLSVNGETVKHPEAGLTLAELAEAKKLPLDFLKGLGLSDLKVKGQPRVVIPYMNQGGEVAEIRKAGRIVPGGEDAAS